jgi:hypothetical protein
LNSRNVLDCLFKSDQIKGFLTDLDIYESDNPSEEERRWISGWGISQRWGFDKRILADRVLSCKLKAYDPYTFEEIDVQKEREKLGEDTVRLQDYTNDITARGLDLLFKRADVEALEAGEKPAHPNIEPGQPDSSSQILLPAQQDINLQESETQRKRVQQERVTQVQKKASNFFTRGEDKHWRVGFNGEESIIDPLDGVHYIATLLQKPGISISCLNLYKLLSGNTPNKLMSEDVAIGEGLNIGSSKQAINSPKARDEYFRKYGKLADDLLKINDLPDSERTPEHVMEAKEIEKEMAEIMPNLKERNFADPNNKKAQSNISRRLDDAYDAILKCGMDNLANYLKTHIKSDGEYGLRYTGAIVWDITIK